MSVWFSSFQPEASCQLWARQVDLVRNRYQVAVSGLGRAAYRCTGEHLTFQLPVAA